MQRQHKKGIIKQYQKHGKDTGSSQVQIAILTEKINRLTEHLKLHKKDKHSRRGLIGMVGQRRKLLRYLHIHEPSEYTNVTQLLQLRK